MPKQNLKAALIQSANIPANALPIAIQKLQRRLKDFEEANIDGYQGSLYDFGASLCAKLDGSLADIFGLNTLEYEQTHLDPSAFVVPFSLGGVSQEDRLAAFKVGQSRGISKITTMLEQLSERLKDSDSIESPFRTLNAYEGLDLHPEIGRAAGDLYRNGHYANAIEDSVKALNGLVRLRSGQELDGTALMEKVFSPNNPILRFNDLKEGPDKDEQKGFMLLFSGAVAGLRNPRAHKLIQDDPERALEFIAFVSLLAKLLDGAKKSVP
jgi:uncharacterized protein (TIGR02391 family)